MTNKTCKNCVYYGKFRMVILPDGFDEMIPCCRFNPPELHKITGKSLDSFNGMFPPVAADDTWCGKFKERATDEAPDTNQEGKFTELKEGEIVTHKILTIDTAYEETFKVRFLNCPETLQHFMYNLRGDDGEFATRDAAFKELPMYFLGGMRDNVINVNYVGKNTAEYFDVSITINPDEYVPREVGGYKTADDLVFEIKMAVENDIRWKNVESRTNHGGNKEREQNKSTQQPFHGNICNL